MKYSALIFSAFIIIIGFYVEDSSQSYSVRCPLPRILNGRVRQRPSGRTIRYNCHAGFDIVGRSTASCRSGRWNSPVPLCVRATCTPIVKPDHALVISLFSGAYLTFFCEPGYELHGSQVSYCNGRTWNATVPTCTKNVTINLPTSCDFENYNLCSWEQDPFHDFDWIIHNFNTPSWHIATGPSYDHTLGRGRSGYYLYIEADDKLENSTARIMSPLYSSDLTTSGCFSFWYHMYGQTIGTLNVYFKAEGETDRTLMFTKSGNQGNHWLHGFFTLPKANSSFQLIVEGVRGASYLSDIAVDDVAILQGDECILNSNPTTEITTTDSDDQIEIVNGMQSCLGRCTDNTNATEDPTNLCQCDLYCSENQNCCPDYTAYCVLGNDTVDFTVENSMENTTPSLIRSNDSSVSPDRVPIIPIIPTNPKDDIDPYTPKIPIDIGPKVSKRTTVVTTTRPSTTTKRPSVTTRRPSFTTRKSITSNTVRTVSKATTKDEKSDSQIDTNNLAEKAHSTSSRERSKVTLPGIIAIVVGAMVGIAGTGLIVFMILQKRNSYKKKSGTSALSDDSDVRFLTSDEMLDFNIAKPEDMEM